MLSKTHFLKAAGEQYGDFVVTKCLPISEVQCILRELVHLPSGAHVMHIENEDPENLFCLSFRTFPTNSNGVAHILEHTVLCGSRRFPVKDPFFSMSRRSLNTFMNAFTGSDFTCYPAASQVEKDYYNLLDVYLDAVFHPTLDRMSFLQEGHHLQFLNPKDPKTPLEIRGIVYNEMKGSMASAENRLWHEMLAQLVPDLPYAFNSGGDPVEIPNLTYPQLVSFHETYYHPSRCLFFFYGNLPLKKHLDTIAEKALKNVPKQPPLTSIPVQKRFKAPIHKKMRFPISESDELSRRSIVAFGYLTTQLTNQEEVLALQVLDTILMETDASPLKKLLLESKLCVHVDAYMDAEMSEVPYLFVFKGCDSKDLETIETAFKKALLKIVEEGIPPSFIEAAIHQLEFTRLEIGGDHAPFGLTLFMRSALAKQHGCPPENALAIHSLFEELLSKVRDPGYLTGLLKKYAIDNPHYVRILMEPDPNLSAEELEQEKRTLEEIKSSLNEKQIAEILKQSADLAEYQKRTDSQSSDCLPKVTLSDVTPVTRDFLLRYHRAGNLDIYHHDCFTNHVLYADLAFDLPHIKEEDLPYVHLLTSLLPELGCGDRSYAQNLEYVHAHTGGVALSSALHLQASDPNKKRPSLNMRGKALDRKIDKLFALMHDTLIRPRFDEKKRIQELIEQLREGQQHRFTHQSMRYAMNLAISGFSHAGYINEVLYGLSYYKTIETLSKDLTKALPRLIDRLIALHEQLFTLHNPLIILTCSQEMYDGIERQAFYGFTELPIKRAFTPWDFHYPLPTVESQARPIASQVAFNVEAFKSVHYLHPHAPALTVATQLLDHKILHPKIREQGGAYGCGATYSSNLGHFCLHSYRDPHIAATFETFHTAVEQIALAGFSEQDLEEAKLGIIQQFDTPISPAHRGVTAYTWLRDNKTKEMRQEFRDRLLALTSKDIKRAVEMDLLPKLSEGICISFAGKQQIEKENAKFLAEGKKPLPLIPI